MVQFKQKKGIKNSTKKNFLKKKGRKKLINCIDVEH